MKSNQMTGRAWVRRVLRQTTLFGGLAGAICMSAGLGSAEDFDRQMPPKAWKNAGPWRAIGISPRKTTSAPMESLAQAPLISPASAQEPASQIGGVVSAIATDSPKQPSLIKTPSIKIEMPALSPSPALRPSAGNAPLSNGMETSRSIGAKVRLSASSISQVPSQGVALESTSTNAAHLKVTRSGDITAETPVKVNFNQERILALPALPSANSPFAETGIEIPVRIEAVDEVVQTILDTHTPMAALPSLGMLPVTPMDIPTLGLPPELESPQEAFDASNANEAVRADTAVANLRTEETEVHDAERLGNNDSNNDSNNESNNDSIHGVPELGVQSRTKEFIESKMAETLNTQVVVPTWVAPALSGRGAGPVSAAASIVPLPRIDATSEEIDAISKLARSTKSSNDKAMTESVLSQPGDEVLITSGPLSKLVDSEAAETVVLETQAIRAVQVPGTICRLHVVDSSVCQVVCNGNRLFIVADQPGETMVEATMGKHQKPLHMKVVVDKPWARGKSASVNLEQMQVIVSHLAPTAEITVQRSEEGGLIVKGFVESNQQAKKVLEAIRKMVLVPVIDQVEVN